MFRAFHFTTVCLVAISLTLGFRGADPPASIDPHEEKGDLRAATSQPASLQPDFQCPEPTLDPTSANFLTGDITALANTQAYVDCYAWQTFIALNWPVDSGWPDDPNKAGERDRSFKASQWGTPPDDPRKDRIQPTCWETFKPAQNIFLPGAKKPSDWGVLDAGPESLLQNSSATLQMPRRTARVLKFLNKFGATDSSPKKRGLQPDETDEATGGWLTDQNGKQVWFERFVNRAEFEYILGNQLYDATQQMVVATNSDGKHPDGIDFPLGKIPSPNKVQGWDQLGAMEIKAAWRVLTDQPDAWPRFHLTKAWLCKPGTNECTSEILGLVGLHIIHKAASFPNFLWATFEQIDNVPDSRNLYSHPNGYSFNNPKCEGEYCTSNVPRSKTSPPPANRPVQTTRVYAIDKSVMQLNLAMQDKIKENNPKSVFQYYQLVNVLWQTTSSRNTKPNQQVPLSFGSALSAGTTPVANTSLETYVQSSSCTDCHRTIATVAGSKTLASDFSFLLGLAQKKKSN